MIKNKEKIKEFEKYLKTIKKGKMEWETFIKKHSKLGLKRTMEVLKRRKAGTQTKRELITAYNDFGRFYVPIRLNLNEQITVFKNLIGEVPFRPSDKILSMGCGWGVLEVFLAKKIIPKGKIIGIDISKEQIKGAKKMAKIKRVKNALFELMDMEHLKFRPKSFNHVISISAIHSIASQFLPTLERAKNVLKKGGYFCFTYDLGFSKKIPNKEIIKRKLESLGFKVKMFPFRFEHPVWKKIDKRKVEHIFVSAHLK